MVLIKPLKTDAAITLAVAASQFLIFGSRLMILREHTLRSAIEHQADE
jgi:hypothetical protein